MPAMVSTIAMATLMMAKITRTLLLLLLLLLR
jgi:hypothetical protein